MSALPLSHRNNAVNPSHVRRWLVGLAMVLALLGGYALALGWLAQRLGADVERSVRMDPAVQEVADRSTE